MGLKSKKYGGDRHGNYLLKSDQNGVEMFISTTNITPNMIIKIRPKWG